MKKLIVVAVAALFATSAIAGDMKWGGSSAWRYTDGKYDDGLNNNDANSKSHSVQKHRQHAVRANFGATGGWKNVEWGVGLRTTGSANSDYVAFANGSTDTALGFDQAWMRYVTGTSFGDFGFTFGRQMNVFAYDMTTQNFFDNDTRFDGFGFSWNWGSFGFNMAEYFFQGYNRGTAGTASYTYTDSTQADNSSSSYFSKMHGFQPHFSWKFSDEIDTKFAFGYYMVDGDTNFTNSTAGATATINGFVTPSGTVAFQNGTVTMANPRWMQLYNSWKLPYKLGFSWEYVSNGRKPKFGTSAVEMNGKAYAAALTYGSIKKAQDWKVGFTYGKKDVGSVISNFSGGRWLPNNKGWVFNADYGLADNFNIGFKTYRLKNVDNINSTTGQALSTAQSVKTTINELVTSVSF
ncbi:MAG: hypothetical protein HUU37_06235 [Bdellovibrionales bacterium]|nr:hypothetical protein [Bdellovibrionales bacterium]